MKTAFYIFVGYAFLGYVYYPSEYSFFSLCLILFYSLPLLIAGIFTKDKTLSNYPNIKPLVFWGIIFLGVLNLGIIANNIDKSISDAFSLEGIKSIAIESTLRRYKGDTLSNSGNPVLLALTLWLIFRTGTLDKQMKNSLQLIAFIPLLSYTLMTTEKWPSFLGVIFYITGIIISNEKKEYRKILISKIKYGIIIFLLMIFSLVLRGNDGGFVEIFDMITHYVFAQYNFLGRWYLDLKSIDLTFGQTTFIGPLSFLGFSSRAAGVFNESLELNGMNSNIYTAFRYIIQDFGVLAPFIFNSIISILYVKTRNFKNIKFNTMLKIIVIFSALISFNTTPFVHNSVVFCLILVLFSDYKAKQIFYK